MRYILSSFAIVLLLATVTFAQQEMPVDTTTLDTVTIADTAATSDTAEMAQNSSAGPVGSTLGLPGQLGESIAKTPSGTEPGQIDPDAEPGFANIPGAPQINYFIAVLWAIWVGWIFSTVGAFGGVMAGFGHITIFGLGDYGQAFAKTSPPLNKLITDTIRVSNQFLVGTTATTTSFNYWRRGQIVLPLALSLGLGSIAGAYAVPALTAGKVAINNYIGWFGVVVLVIGGFLLYQVSPWGTRSQDKAKAAAKKFQQSVREKGTSVKRGVQLQKVSLFKTRFTFYGIEFHFNPILPFIGGFVIAAIAAFFGIGGGFLYVPFMTALVGLPMFLVAGTSALAVLLGMITSIITYIVVGGVYVNWGLVGTEMVGVVIGSMIGPRTQKFIPEKVLKIIFVILALYVGLRYLSVGFFGTSWLPPY